MENENTFILKIFQNRQTLWPVYRLTIQPKDIVDPSLRSVIVRMESDFQNGWIFKGLDKTVWGKWIPEIPFPNDVCLI